MGVFLSLFKYRDFCGYIKFLFFLKWLDLNKEDVVDEKLYILNRKIFRVVFFLFKRDFLNI